MAAAAATIALVLAGCATEAKKDTAAEAKVEAPPPPPPPPPKPVVHSPEQARALTRDALEPLQAGDEEKARVMLEQAQLLDPGYELPRRLLQQIFSDPQRDYGSQSFTYRVERGDTLATIAQRFLNDKYLFYALAKYNDIKVPKNLTVGQTIRIWGKPPRVAPPRVAAAESALEPRVAEPPRPQVEAPAKPPEPPPAPAPEVPKVSPARAEADKLVAQGQRAQQTGRPEAALAAYDAALKRDPSHPDAARLAASARKEQAALLNKEATAEFSRQNLCTAISLWNRVIELDPEQRLAPMKRAQALELREKLCKIDETRCCALSR
jgi:tetratricopeptide (TPR) repeat protein